MSDFLFWLYLLNSVLLINHEIDSAALLCQPLSRVRFHGRKVRTISDLPLPQELQG